MGKRLDFIKTKLHINTPATPAATSGTGDASNSTPAPAAKSSTRETSFLGALGSKRKKSAVAADSSDVAAPLSEKAQGKQAIGPRSRLPSRTVTFKDGDVVHGHDIHDIYKSESVSDIDVDHADPEGQWSSQKGTLPLEEPRPTKELSVEFVDAIVCSAKAPKGKFIDVYGIPGTNPYNFETKDGEKVKGRSMSVMETKKGRIISGGYHDDKFSIQSVSKPLIAAFAAQYIDLKRYKKIIKSEGSGRTYNHGDQPAPGKEYNGSDNRGAMHSWSLAIAAGKNMGISEEEMLQKFIQFVRDIADNQTITYNKEMAQGETDFRLTGLDEDGNEVPVDPANVKNIKKMAEKGELDKNDPMNVFESYNKGCALEMTTEDAVHIFAVVKYGVSPVSRNKQFLDPKIAKHISRGLAEHGSYDESGNFYCKTESRTKTGVGGLIVGESGLNPGFMMAAHEPGLNRNGNPGEPKKMFDLINQHKLVVPERVSKHKDYDKFMAELEALPPSQDQIHDVFAGQLHDADRLDLERLVRELPREQEKLKYFQGKFENPAMKTGIQLKAWKSDAQLFDPTDPDKFDRDPGVPANPDAVTFKKHTPIKTAVGRDGVKREYYWADDDTGYLAKVYVKRVDGGTDDIKPEMRDELLAETYRKGAESLDSSRDEGGEVKDSSSKEKPTREDAGVGSSKVAGSRSFKDSFFGALSSTGPSVSKTKKVKPDTAAKVTPTVTKRAEEKPARETPVDKKSTVAPALALPDVPNVKEDDGTFLGIDFSSGDDKGASPKA